jgi:hypothetical protein
MRRLIRGLGVLTLLAGSAVALTSGTALAASCGTALAGSCTLTGTANIGGGTLTMTMPASLSWSTTLTGSTQDLVDATAADQGYLVQDETGSGAGWHVTTSATTFTFGTATFADTGTFSTNGSVTSISSAAAPTATCVTTCTLPTDTTTYPVAIKTAAASPQAFNVYDTPATTGMGDITIGGSTATDPVGWWVVVPPTATAGAYTSTITMTIVSGP